MKRVCFFAVVFTTLFYSISFGYSGGDGTSVNPYRISSKANLLALGATSADYDKCFILTADIDLTGESFTTAVIAPDTSTASGFQGTYFSGVFDGRGYTIKNLTITGTGAYNALFGYVSVAGRIKNLGVETINSMSTGGLAAYNYGIISFCYTTGSILGGNAAGGLVGINNGSISCSYSTASVSVPGGIMLLSYGGGLVGTLRDGAIDSCYAAGAVTGGGTFGCGGLVGSFTGGTITSCFWDTQTSGRSVGIGLGSSSGVTGKTTAEMKTLSTFTDAGWDFSSADSDAADWIMPTDSYPQAKCFQRVVVPDVLGVIITDIMSVLNPLELKIGTVLGYNSTSIPEGAIMYQQPSAGQSVPIGREIRFDISLGTGLPGSGTPEDPYRICNDVQFYSLSLIPEKWCCSASFKLMVDVDMANLPLTQPLIAPDTNSGNTDFDGPAFCAGFDGNHHTISNLTIAGHGRDYVGLFGYAACGLIKNLGLVNVNIAGRSYVGGLVGRLAEGTITNCYTTGTIHSGGGTLNVAGGLVGYGSGTLSNCRSSCSVLSAASSTLSSAGGLVGSQSYGSITQCCSTGPVTSSEASSSYAGGLVGYLNTCPTVNSWSTGPVTCYTWPSAPSFSCAGGLAGDIKASTVSYCYAAGAVNCTGNVGGFAGYNDSSSVIRCFWDRQTSGQATSAGGIDKTTSEMKTLSTFTSFSWDFANIWAICEGTNYPRLQWQIPAGDFVCPDGVSTEDLEYWVERWMLDGCMPGNNYCGGADMDVSGAVDLADWAILAAEWMEGI